MTTTAPAAIVRGALPASPATFTGSTTSYVREAERATAGRYADGLVWLGRFASRSANAAAAIRTLKARHKLCPGTHFKVESSGFILVYTPAPPTGGGTPVSAPAATSRFLDADVAAMLDPRISIRTVYGRSGPRHAYVVNGVQHRSAAAAQRALPIVRAADGNVVELRVDRMAQIRLSCEAIGTSLAAARLLREDRMRSLRASLRVTA